MIDPSNGSVLTQLAGGHSIGCSAQLIWDVEVGEELGLDEMDLAKVGRSGDDVEMGSVFYGFSVVAVSVDAEVGIRAGLWKLVVCWKCDGLWKGRLRGQTWWCGTHMGWVKYVGCISSTVRAGLHCCQPNRCDGVCLRTLLRIRVRRCYVENRVRPRQIIQRRPSMPVFAS